MESSILRIWGGEGGGDRQGAGEREGGERKEGGEEGGG